MMKMEMIAEKRVLELSDQGNVTLTTMYAVKEGETVEGLMRRVGITGRRWEYDMFELRIRLVNPYNATPPASGEEDGR